MLRRLAIVALFLFVLVRSGRALADAPGAKATPLYVLELDTDTADEQAEALTAALRSQVREAKGWSLAETNQPLSTLMVAFRCPLKPDPNCMQRIGEHLKADRFLWGQMVKKGKQVTAEVHLYFRGKADSLTVETYSDNLKDAGDPALSRIAARIFSRLTGAIVTGSVTISAGKAGGTVFLDDQVRGELSSGKLRLEVPSGSTHSLEVRVPGMQPSKQTISVSPGSETELSVPLIPVAVDKPPPHKAPPPKSGWTLRKVAEWGTVAVGAGFLIASGVEALVYASNKSDTKDRASQIADSVCRRDPSQCQPAGKAPDGRDRYTLDAGTYCSSSPAPDTVDLCRQLTSSRDRADSAQRNQFIFLGVGGALAITGAVLILTDHDGPSEEKSSKGLKVRVLAGPTGGSIVGTF